MAATRGEVRLLHCRRRRRRSSGVAARLGGGPPPPPPAGVGSACSDSEAFWQTLCGMVQPTGVPARGHPQYRIVLLWRNPGQVTHHAFMRSYLAVGICGENYSYS